MWKIKNCQAKPENKNKSTTVPSPKAEALKNSKGGHKIEKDNFGGKIDASFGTNLSKDAKKLWDDTKKFFNKLGKK